MTIPYRAYFEAVKQGFAVMTNEDGTALLPEERLARGRLLTAAFKQTLPNPTPAVDAKDAARLMAPFERYLLLRYSEHEADPASVPEWRRYTALSAVLRDKAIEGGIPEAELERQLSNLLLAAFPLELPSNASTQSPAPVITGALRAKRLAERIIGSKVVPAADDGGSEAPPLQAWQAARKKSVEQVMNQNLKTGLGAEAALINYLSTGSAQARRSQDTENAPLKAQLVADLRAEPALPEAALRPMLQAFFDAAGRGEGLDAESVSKSLGHSRYFLTQYLESEVLMLAPPDRVSLASVLENSLAGPDLVDLLRAQPEDTVIKPALRTFLDLSRRSGLTAQNLSRAIGEHENFVSHYLTSNRTLAPRQLDRLAEALERLTSNRQAAAAAPVHDDPKPGKAASAAPRVKPKALASPPSDSPAASPAAAPPVISNVDTMTALLKENPLTDDFALKKQLKVFSKAHRGRGFGAVQISRAMGERDSFIHSYLKGSPSHLSSERREKLAAALDDIAQNPWRRLPKASSPSLVDYSLSSVETPRDDTPTAILAAGQEVSLSAQLNKSERPAEDPLWNSRLITRAQQAHGPAKGR